MTLQPARSTLSYFLTCLTTGQRVKGTILDRVLDFNLSPAGIALDRVPRVELGGRRDGHVLRPAPSRRLPHPWVCLIPHGMPDEFS
jgi:hypothetical protein